MRAPRRDSDSRRAFLRGGFLRVLAPVRREEPRIAPVDPELAPEQGVFARILPTACIAFRGALCVTCEERCPVSGAVRIEAGRPRIDPELCDGCGICVDACPAPRKAIVQVPRPPRPRTEP